MPTLYLGFITAFVLTYLAIPTIIMVAREHDLFDKPNERSSHEAPTPSLGGIGIFGGAICGIILWTPYLDFGTLQYTLAAFILMFLVGVRDDLVPLSPTKKFVIQMLAAVILTYKGQVLVTHWWGVLGITHLPPLFSLVFSLVVIVGIVNSFNLIDGINGLAGSLGLSAAVVFGSWFFWAGHLEWAVVAFSLAGALVAFLKFNFTPARIFMGDTGSLFVGLACSVLAIQFLELNQQLPPDASWRYHSAPAVVVAVLLLPVYDTVRVFARRIVQGRSPFHADKTHIHHLLLQCGLNHMQATGCLVAVTWVFVALALGLQHLGTSWLLLIELVLAVLFNLILARVAATHSGVQVRDNG